MPRGDYTYPVRKGQKVSNTTGHIGRIGMPNGAGDRDRTGDIQLGKLAFYR
jgi:hypothetical protein